MAISQGAYRVDRSYQWNYSHAPGLPRLRRLPPGPGGILLGRPVNSSLGIAAGPLLNSKWVEAYARLGFELPLFERVLVVVASPHLHNLLPNPAPDTTMWNAADWWLD